MKKYNTRKFIKTLFSTAACLFCSGAFGETVKLNPKYKKVRARITYYTSDRKYGIKVADPKTKFAIEGVTVAAHPNFKFGSKIFIPSLKSKIGDGYYLVQDRGNAVTLKKASKGNGYVFDVYVSSHQTLKSMAKNMPMWMDVHICS